MDCYRLRPDGKELFGDYPAVMVPEMECDNPQYKITRKDGRPCFELTAPTQNKNYEPTGDMNGPEDVGLITLILLPKKG